jgi:hypothetical protein
MIKYNVAVLSCIRNCEIHLEESFHYISEFKKLFKSVHFFAAENDSKDNSFEIAKKYSKNLDGEIYQFNGLKNQFKYKTHLLAYLRNFLLQKAQGFDYIIVLDVDSILHNFDIEGLKSCFDYDINSWDAFGANCNDRYYDVWTLRDNKLNYDCWDRVHHDRQNGWIDITSIRNHIANFQVKINSSSKIIPVKSCFGGMMIYKASSILNCEYSGVFKKCESLKYKNNTVCRPDVCEHVNLNYEAIEKNKAKIFINPRLIVNCQIEHLF